MATPLSPAARNLAHGFIQDTASVEQEQDANWALTELDKGLRSMKLGVQCESVVRFPRLFEKFPFPILINAAFLRLADVFRGGNNFLRWCILGVTQQSEKHLEKVLNIDEFMRRIYQVIHSNDPIARALTIRTLGSIASIIPERKNVHHTIVNGLDSHDALEVDAAVYAADRFAAKSRTFAANICGKMANMIEEIATPVDLKLRLIPVLQHMHHDAVTAAKARGVCIKLLSSFPAHKFVSSILSTMTKLAADSLVDIQHQLELLITKLKEDPRKTIKLVSLQNLNILAKRSPHQWKYTYVETLCDFVLSTGITVLKIHSLRVLTTLSDSVAFQLFLPKQEVNMELILEVCNLCYSSENSTLSSQAVEFYCNVAVCHKKTSVMWDMDSDLVEGARLAVTTQMCLSAWNTEPKEQTSLKLCLFCAVRLVKAFPETANFFVSEIVHLLETVSEKNAAMLCEGLAAIGSENNKMVTEIIPQLLSLYQIYTSTPGCQQLQSYIGTVLFQAAGGEAVPSHVKNLLSNSIKNSANPWFAYKLGRQAMRYGQYPVAAEIFHILSQEVASEHFHFWLSGLREICLAESCLQTDSKIYNDITRVDDSLIHYQKGLASLKAASTPSFPMLFQSEFVNLRVAILQVHSQLIRTCNTFRTCPPPAIATALAMANGQDISRCGQIINQLGKCVKSYEDLSDKYAALYQTSFDADPATLDNLQLLQQSCELMKSAILSVTNINQTEFGQMLSLSSSSSGHSDLDSALKDIHKQFNELTQNVSGEQTLAHQHINLLCNSVQTFVNTSLRYPRFFFQNLQSTTLKLAVTPQHNIQMDPILVHYNTFQTVKIEGIILHGQRREMFRKIDKVHLSVKTDLINKETSTTDVKVTDQTSNHMVQSVEPHNDYFTVSFLLAFPMTGLHKLDIEAAVIDETGTLWKTGPHVTLTIKSYDESIVKKQSKPASIRTSFGQMPTPP